MKVTIDIDDIELACDAIEAAIPYLGERTADIEDEEDVEWVECVYGRWADALADLRKAIARGTSV